MRDLARSQHLRHLHHRRRTRVVATPDGLAIERCQGGIPAAGGVALQLWHLLEGAQVGEAPSGEAADEACGARRAYDRH